MVCGVGDGEETLKGDDVHVLDKPLIWENALAPCFHPYTGDPPASIECILMPEATGDDASRVILADYDPTFISPGPTGAEYPEGVDGARHPMLFHHPPHSGPGPRSYFDMSSVDLGTMSNDETQSLCFPSDAESTNQ